MENTSYMDLGSDTDDDEYNLAGDLDSDEEERHENETLMKLMMSSMPYTKTKQCRDVDEFQAEMEAELDKRALAVESHGGVEHQKSLSRSSSSPIHKLTQSPVSPALQEQKPSGIAKLKKSVKFVDAPTSTKPSPKSSDSGPPGEPRTVLEEKKEFYDSIYFDSDESEGEDDTVKSVRQKKRSFLSNDDLLYDPESDARDQAWVDRRRKKYCPPQSQDERSSSNSNSTPSTSKSISPKIRKPPAGLPTSDAVLNCPACFTILCLDCQRHEVYKSQYRAMFVLNCIIDNSETLRVPLKEPKGRKNRNKYLDISTQDSPNPKTDLFNPVKCKICATQVAVYDSEKVYHLFNVLASYA